MDRIVLCDICGTKLPAVRATLKSKIGDVYKGMEISLDCFPDDDVECDTQAIHKVCEGLSGTGVLGCPPHLDDQQIHTRALPEDVRWDPFPLGCPVRRLPPLPP